jgi:hypothetical protein
LPPASGGGVVGDHIRVFVPWRGDSARGRARWPLAAGGFAASGALGGGVVNGDRVAIGVAVRDGPTTGFPDPGVGGRGATRVTSAELASTTVLWVMPLIGPSGSSSERSFFSPSATLSSSTTVGPL